jgi:hypothetical protein
MCRVSLVVCYRAFVIYLSWVQGWTKRLLQITRLIKGKTSVWKENDKMASIKSNAIANQKD